MPSEQFFGNGYVDLRDGDASILLYMGVRILEHRQSRSSWEELTLATFRTSLTSSGFGHVSLHLKDLVTDEFTRQMMISLLSEIVRTLKVVFGESLPKSWLNDSGQLHAFYLKDQPMSVVAVNVASLEGLLMAHSFETTNGETSKY